MEERRAITFKTTGRDGEFLVLEEDPVNKVCIRHSDIVEICTENKVLCTTWPYRTTVYMNGGHVYVLGSLSLEAAEELFEFLTNHTIKAPAEKKLKSQLRITHFHEVRKERASDARPYGNGTSVN
jgi:hypothetical protein